MRQFHKFMAISTGLLCSVNVQAGEEQAGDAEFQKELLAIEEKVTALKKNVFGAKATLNLLRELVVQSSVSGSKANIWQINNLGSSYAITNVSYTLDGESIKRESDSSGDKNSKAQQMIFDGEMNVGEHNLVVELELTGQGRGLFTYVNDYKFTVRSATSFSSEEGENCVIRTIAETRSALNYSFEERPNIVFQTICSEMGE